MTHEEKILDALSRQDLRIADLQEITGLCYSRMKTIVREMREAGKLFKYFRNSKTYFTLDEQRQIDRETFDPAIIKRRIVEKLSDGAVLKSTEIRRAVCYRMEAAAFNQLLEQLVIENAIIQDRLYTSGNVHYAYRTFVRHPLDYIYAPMPSLSGEVIMECDSDDYHTMPGLTVKQGQSYGVANYAGM